MRFDLELLFKERRIASIGNETGAQQLSKNDKSTFLGFLDEIVGYGKAFATLILAPIGGLALHGQLSEKVWPTFGVEDSSHWIATSALVTLLVTAFFGAWYVMFRQESRLENRERFNLRAHDRKTLIGRDDEIESLLLVAKHNRILFLDGESGCGKSALVEAGLLPKLRDDAAWLPLLVRDWGENWETDPLRSLVGTLFEELGEEGRNALDWRHAPDLALDAPELAEILNQRVAQVLEILGRRVFLILDQFDDYQAIHRSRFLTTELTWISPKALVKKNKFWAQIHRSLKASHLHLMVVTRDDNANGLASVRFPDISSKSKTLFRLDAESAQPILISLARDDEKPPVVSRPEKGWHELRRVIASDLETGGTVLMQQFRIVLLGLRELPRLTLGHYRTVGGLSGIEALYIKRAVQACAQGTTGATQSDARKLLSLFVDKGEAGQSAITRTISQRDLLVDKERDRQNLEILRILTKKEVLRSVSRVGMEETAWRLDHDYLARAVVIDARNEDKLAVALEEGHRAFESARGSLQMQFQTLLGPIVWVRIAFDCARNRLSIRSSARYFGASALKPLLTLGLIASPIALYWQTQRAEQVDLITNAIGSGNEFGDQLLTVWTGPDWLRSRILQHLAQPQNRGQLRTALNVGWLNAHAAWDNERLKEIAVLLRERLHSSDIDSDDLEEAYLETYASALGRIGDSTFLDSETVFWRESIELVGTEDPHTVRFFEGYEHALRNLKPGPRLDFELTFLRQKYESSANFREAQYGYKSAYREALARLDDGPLLRSEITHFREALESLDNDNDYDQLDDYLDFLETALGQLDQGKFLNSQLVHLREKAAESKTWGLTGYLYSYQRSLRHVRDGPFLEREVAALRQEVEAQASRPYKNRSYLQAYLRGLEQLDDGPALRTGIIEIQQVLEEISDQPDDQIKLLGAYWELLKKLDNGPFLHSQISYWRNKIDPKTSRIDEREWDHSSYTTGLKLLDDGVFLRAEIGFIRRELDRQIGNPDKHGAYRRSYLWALSRLEDGPFLRSQLEHLRRQPDAPVFTFSDDRFSDYHAEILGKLDDQTFLESEALVLRKAIDASDGGNGDLLYAYAIVLSQLAQGETLRSGVSYLRKGLDVSNGGLDDLERESVHEKHLYAYEQYMEFRLRWANREEQKRLIEEALTLATHPFSQGNYAFMDVIASAAHTQFEDDQRKAFEWAQSEFGTTRSQLRPSRSDYQ